MTPKPSEIASSLTQKYQVLHEAFTDFNFDATRFHSDLKVDDASRGMFNSLCRILAFSDQLHITLSLMREDVRCIEAAYSDAATAVWVEQFDDLLDDWLSKASVANSKVN